MYITPTNVLYKQFDVLMIQYFAGNAGRVEGHPSQLQYIETGAEKQSTSGYRCFKMV